MSAFVSHTITVSSAACDIGGGEKQQDVGFTAELTTPSGRSATVAAVFDGHGAKRGEVFSRMTSDLFRSEMQSDEWLEQFLAAPEDVGQQLFAKAAAEAFRLAENLLKTNNKQYRVEGGFLITPELALIHGGTTATLVIAIDDGTVHCFNVGDSEAWLCNENGRTNLHTDHSPDNEDEYKRIMAFSPSSNIVYDYNPLCHQARRRDGDHVFPRRGGFHGYYHKNVRREYATLFCANGYRLAMTRSIGDEPMRPGGLSAKPSYKRITVEHTSIIRIATDGFWDNIALDEIVFPQSDLDADALNASWFRETEQQGLANFGAGRDNMWSYTMVIEC
jgi:serine/threonine protein phosphatase PrpC